MSAAGARTRTLPVVVVPVGVDDQALDACLAALDATTPPGTRVWLADDAQAGPRGVEIIGRWLASTRLCADYTRRQRAIGAVAHLDECLAACADADVAVLACDAVPTPGWLEQLQACLDRDAAIATATPWSNAGEAASWPRIGEITPLQQPAGLLAAAAAAMAPRHPELPAAVSHAVLLRGKARHKAGGLDTSSFGAWYAALIDLSLRLSGMGWRNVLCETAFVVRQAEGIATEGDMEALAARWPDWHARLAKFLMDDALHDRRTELHARLAALGKGDAQQELFVASEAVVETLAGEPDAASHADDVEQAAPAAGKAPGDD